MNPTPPVEGQGDGGPAPYAGAPKACASADLLGITQRTVEASVGRERYAEMLYRASYTSARYWCDREARAHGLSGMAVFDHYLSRLSRCGWGRFSVIQADAATGTADVRLDHSDFVPARGDVCSSKICFRFAGWFAGVMDWISENTGRPVRTLCCESRCGADGHGHCVFAVRPRGRY